MNMTIREEHNAMAGAIINILTKAWADARAEDDSLPELLPGDAIISRFQFTLGPVHVEAETNHASYIHDEDYDQLAVDTPHRTPPEAVRGSVILTHVRDGEEGVCIVVNLRKDRSRITSQLRDAFREWWAEALEWNKAEQERERRKALVLSQAELFIKGFDTECWKGMDWSGEDYCLVGTAYDRPYSTLRLWCEQGDEPEVLASIRLREIPPRLALELCNMVRQWEREREAHKSPPITRAQVVDAIYDVLQGSPYSLRDHVKDLKMAEESVWEGDPYGWASDASFTFSNESGLPGYNDPMAMEFWFDVDRYIAENYTANQQLYFSEFVNGGVTAMYRSTAD